MVREVIRNNSAELSRTEQRVIVERFALKAGEKPRTLSEVGKIVGLSNERVRQIERSSLFKIRAAMEEHPAA
jgi:DNA-directed RNA polymerase sigma subunit (sigma70/sigma32)